MNISEIKNLCNELGFKPSRRFGQNFLFSQNAVAAIIKAADLKPTDTVLEVGPGLGVLTAELAGRAKRVVAVELDGTMADFLKENLARHKNLEIIKADILKYDPLNLGEYKVVANLPYNITSHFLQIFLSAANKPQKLVLTIQKEVAERIIAGPGQMSLLAVSVQFYGQPKIIHRIKKTAFWPQPKVDSAVIEIEVYPQVKMKQRLAFADAADYLSELEFFKVIKTGFSQRRKQLAGNLAKKFHLETDQILKIFQNLKLNPKIRAQELTIEQWLDLAKSLKKCCNFSNF